LKLTTSPKSYLKPIYGLNGKLIFLLFSLITIIIRFPFFFRDYINRDESTFILMGQSWVDGHLPYTELWDLKPPLVFLFFASIIYVFGKSFIAIRLIGALVIASTSFIIYKIGIKIHSKKAGLWMGLLYIYTSSLFGDVQGVMSEHLSMFFFLFAFYFILIKKGIQDVLWAGIFFGCALLMKINLSYAFLFTSIGYFYSHLQNYLLKIILPY